MKRLLLTLVIAILAISFAAVPAFAELNPDDIADDAILYELDTECYTVNIDYEGGIPNEDYAFTAAGDLGVQGISFMDPLYSYVKLVEGDQAISGEMSLAIKGYLDSRIWSLSLIEGDGDYVFFEYKIKVISQGEAGSTLFYVCISDPDVEGTNSEGSGGMIGQIVCGETAPQIINNDEEVIYTFPTIGDVYTVAFAINYGTADYDVFVNGVRVSTGNKWVGDLNSINAVRWDLHGAFGDTAAIAADTREIVIDDLIVTYGNEVSKEQYFATPAPTAEPTATPEPVPTEDPSAPTTAPAEPTKAPEEKSGCGSVVVSSAIVSMMTVLAAAVVLKKH